jgi:DNA-binding NarL/FixJ family response regulator
LIEILSEVVLDGFLKEGQTAPAMASDRLSSREREIEGRSNKEIARDLALSVKTVETHRGSVMRKLGVSSLAELVRWAVRNRIVEA